MVFARVLGGLFCILMLSGCGPFQKQAALTPPREGECVVIDDVSIRIKRLLDVECIRFFDRSLVAAQHIQPIQIYVKNSSSKPWVLAGDRVSLPLMKKAELAPFVKKNTLVRSLLLLTAATLILWRIFLPWCALDLVSCVVMNNKVQKELGDHCFEPQDSYVIQPGERLHKVGFYSLDVPATKCTITLTEQDAGTEKVFSF